MFKRCTLEIWVALYRNCYCYYTIGALVLLDEHDSSVKYMTAQILYCRHICSIIAVELLYRQIPEWVRKVSI